jgi:hypothetical protein
MFGSYCDDTSLSRLRGEEVRHLEFVREVSIGTSSSHRLRKLAVPFGETTKDGCERSEVRVRKMKEEAV